MKDIMLQAAIIFSIICFSAYASAANAYGEWENGPPDDESYFPLAVWLQSPSNAGKYQDIGINTFVGLWQGPTESQLSTLDSADMPVIASQNQVGLDSDNNHVIQAWMHGDEPDNAQWNSTTSSYDPCISPDTLIDDYNEIKANDNTRPVFVNFGQGVANTDWHGRGACTGDTDYYYDATKSADIISYDIYPVTNPEINGQLEYVAYGVSNLIKWSNGTKIVWNCIETTHVGCTDALPTPEQVNTEIWMSIIAGSRGIIYFVHDTCRTGNPVTFREDGIFRYPEIVEQVNLTNRRITELAPVLNTENRTSVSVQSDIDVAILEIPYNGYIYLFSVAMENNPGEATFSMPGVISYAEVLYEDRTISVEDEFSDNFSGYDVHIYRISETDSECGDGVIQGMEQCEGDDIGIYGDGTDKCSEVVGFESGDIGCNPKGELDECLFDFSNCVQASCIPITTDELNDKITDWKQGILEMDELVDQIIQFKIGC